MEGAIDEVVKAEGAFEQYIELLCLRTRLDTDREEAKQAKLSFPASRENRTQNSSRSEEPSSGEEREIELEDAKTPNNKAL